MLELLTTTQRIYALQLAAIVKDKTPQQSAAVPDSWRPTEDVIDFLQPP